jgi:hypothetical protein
VPVGVPDPEDLVTVAVKVTGLPRPDGLGEEVSTVVVAIGAVTSSEMTGEVLVSKFVSPAYTAYRLSVPAGSDQVTKVAWPEVNVAVPAGLWLPLGVPR